MVVGVTVLAGLALLALLADRGTSLLGHGSPTVGLHYCERCDLRYPVTELGDLADRRCPRGHPVKAEPHELPLGTIAIVGCVVVIVICVLLLASGAVPA